MTARLVHPFADIIPPMMTDELADLERDIVANGLRNRSRYSTERF